MVDDGSEGSVPGGVARNYTEAYAYDLADNFRTIVHTASNGGWTRTYTTPASSNRLASTSAAELFGYDTSGNLLAMPHLSMMAWDFANRLLTTAQQVVNDGDPETTWYSYGLDGQRVRKTTVSTAGRPAHERIYLDGYEVYREYSPADGITLERRTVMLTDAGRQLALVETTPGTAGKSDEAAVRYQFANHLGSASLELEKNAAVITYEEYYPYGATSFQAGRSVAEASLKRYRFSGKERDEKSGLSCHSARYYAPWLGRWSSPDPAGLVDRPNLFTYCRGNPVRLTDPTGHDGDDDPALPRRSPRRPTPGRRDTSTTRAASSSTEAVLWTPAGVRACLCSSASDTGSPTI